LRWSLLAMIPALGGCFRTASVWNGTSERTMEAAGAVALIETDAGRAVVVEYQVGRRAVITPRYVLVPIGADGGAAPVTQPSATYDEVWFRHARRGEGFRALEWEETEWKGARHDDGSRTLHYWPHDTPPPDRSTRFVDIPPGTATVVVPEKLPRSNEHIRAGRCRALLLTPLTVALDALILPMGLVECYGLGKCP
jgi:hypothetical protein